MPRWLSAIRQTVITEVLNNKGARIADFDDWTPRVEGKRFSLTGKLSTRRPAEGVQFDRRADCRVRCGVE